MRIATFIATFSVLLLGVALGSNSKKREEASSTPPLRLIERTVDHLIARLRPEDRKQICAMKGEDEMMMFDSGYYTLNDLRSRELWNNPKLDPAFKKIGIWHPEDRGAILGTCIWRRLHRQDLNIPQQVAFYLAYWKENKELINEPCPLCAKVLHWRMSFPLIYVSKPEMAEAPPSQNPKEIQKMIHWYRCPEGHEFIWTSATGLRTPDAAQIEARPKVNSRLRL